MVHSSDLASSRTCTISTIYTVCGRKNGIGRVKYILSCSHILATVSRQSQSEAKGHFGTPTAVDVCATKVTLIRGANITGLHFIIIVEGR